LQQAIHLVVVVVGVLPGAALLQVVDFHEQVVFPPEAFPLADQPGTVPLQEVDWLEAQGVLLAEQMAQPGHYSSVSWEVGP
jgi:hypothetical protein